MDQSTAKFLFLVIVGFAAYCGYSFAKSNAELDMAVKEKELQRCKDSAAFFGK